MPTISAQISVPMIEPRAPKRLVPPSTRLLERAADHTLVAVDPNVRPDVVADRDAYCDRFERWSGFAHVISSATPTRVGCTPAPTPSRLSTS
jgi:fructokinase